MRWLRREDSKHDEQQAIANLATELRALRQELQQTRQTVQDQTEALQSVVGRLEKKEGRWFDRLWQLCIGLIGVGIPGSVYILAVWTLVSEVVQGSNWSDFGTYVTIGEVLLALASATAIGWQFKHRQDLPTLMERPTHAAIGILFLYFSMLYPLTLWLPTWVQGTVWEGRLSTIGWMGIRLTAVFCIYVQGLILVRSIRDVVPTPMSTYLPRLNKLEEIIVYGVFIFTALFLLINPETNLFTMSQR